MDPAEASSRGKGLLLGSFLLIVGGLLALYGVMYDPVDAVDPSGLTGTLEVTDGRRDLFALIALVGVVLGAWASYLYRGSVAMQVMCGVVVVASAFNLVGILPYF
ncbi:hypothetical protein GCM10011519_17320 [Marmoricola endophyticus]|uniref:Uncharacterized protein n=1 Tax=Marmoricola endophyticus TaxID=2040280 RepID=A0A917F2H0_9ACTN|nr:hypothetical protein [Marmoricola endophyticus]GGF44034.1 hypothetical protein GCM10011519_17320 [Marmoricola endophyticus]